VSSLPASATQLSTSSSAGPPQQQAEANAALLVKAFVPPPGARGESRSPVPSSPLSSGSRALHPADDDVVTGTGWWLVPGDPQHLLAWEAARLRSRYPLTGWGTTGHGIYSDDFTVSAVPGLFDERGLTISATAAGHGQTAIRVDAAVDWIPARPAGDTVPAAAKVTALAAYLDHLPVSPPGAITSCPAGSGISGLTVTFRARAGDPVLAQAAVVVDGCASLSYTMPDQPPAALGGTDGGDSLLTEVNHVAGLHWKFP
jgi:hypothetical protein